MTKEYFPDGTLVDDWFYDIKIPELSEIGKQYELTKHGRLALSDSGEYFVHADGTPFFWLADTSWFAFGDRGDFETIFKPYIDQRAQEGYTVFQTCIWVSNVMDQLQLGNEGGNQWNGAIWRDINPEYWDWVEKRVQYLVDNGMVPVLGFGLLAAVLWFWYPLHKKQVDANVAALKEKHGR